MNSFFKLVALFCLFISFAHAQDKQPPVLKEAAPPPIKEQKPKDGCTNIKVNDEITVQWALIL